MVELVELLALIVTEKVHAKELVVKVLEDQQIRTVNAFTVKELVASKSTQ